MSKKEQAQKKPRRAWLRKIGKTAKWIGISLLGVVVLFSLVVGILRTANGARTDIKTENGIQEELYVDINGIRQFLQIRGQDQDNPILFFVHGGPGSPMAYVSYAWQTGLESKYTIVHWDQRGCGRTYFENQDTDAPAATTELLLLDMDAIIDYLCNRFGQQKVILMGHSWGSALGSQYIVAHPEKIAAYIGVGQAIHLKAGYALAAEEAIARARAAGKEKDAADIAVYLKAVEASDKADDATIENAVKMTALTGKYLPNEGSTSMGDMIWAALTSADFSWRDLRWLLTDPTSATEKLMADCLAFDIEQYEAAYQVPVYFIMGEHDWTTPTQLVAAHYEQMSAPDKAMIVLENTGHTPFLDNPDAFCEAVEQCLS